MSWDVKIRKINHIKPIENSDNLELAFIQSWPLVVRKGEYKTGDLAAYIPADSLVPQELLRTMGLEGKLAGSQKNRVKAIKLRKQLSIGLLHKMPGYEEGTEVSQILGITKYEEPIPPELSGIARKHPRGWIKYDIENINNTSDWFSEADDVCIMEKLHGCFEATSKVLMSDLSYKEISKIKPGETVKSYDSAQKKFVNKKVLRNINSGKSELVAWIKIKLENDKIITCTSNHLILTKNGWKKAAHLTSLDEIIHY